MNDKELLKSNLALFEHAQAKNPNTHLLRAIKIYQRALERIEMKEKQRVNT